MSPSFLHLFLLLGFEVGWEYFQAFPQTSNLDGNLIFVISFPNLSLNTKVEPKGLQHLHECEKMQTV